MEDREKAATGLSEIAVWLIESRLRAGSLKALDNEMGECLGVWTGRRWGVGKAAKQEHRRLKTQVFV